MSPKRLLPFSYPYMTCYPKHANVIAILTANGQPLDWFYQNYLQLYAVTLREFSTYIDFWAPLPWHCPYLETKRVPTLYDRPICPDLLSAIDDGYYPFLYLNHGELRAAEVYGNKTYAHDVLLYGYDLDSKTIYLADFFSHEYKCATASFQEIEAAYQSMRFHPIANDNLDGILYMRPRAATSRLDIERFKANIADYLMGKQSVTELEGYDKYFRTHRSKFVFGLDVYHYLASILEAHVSEEREYVDLRGFYVLCRHKEHFLRVLRYLEEQGYLQKKQPISSFCDSLMAKTFRLHNKLIKYNFTHKPSELAAVLHEIPVLEQEDRGFFQFLQESIATGLQ